MTNWTEDRFTNDVLAIPFQKISPETWMQRRNIQLVTDEQWGTYYTCESRTITNDEYIEYLSDLNNKNTADIDYLAMMVDVEIPSEEG